MSARTRQGGRRRGGMDGHAGDAGVRGLRVAVVNWGDPWHPAAGGAERYAWELARRLAARGARVRCLTCRAPGQRRRERAEGVEFVRLGGRFSVYPLVLLWMLARRGPPGRPFDAVLDVPGGLRQMREATPEERLLGRPGDGPPGD